jgi:hypothetical protein
VVAGSNPAGVAKITVLGANGTGPFCVTQGAFSPSIRPPPPIAIRRDLNRHYYPAFGNSCRRHFEQLVAVRIMALRNDRHRRPGLLRLRHDLTLQRFRIQSTLRCAQPLLSVHYAASGHLSCLIHHPLIIAPNRRSAAGAPHRALTIILEIT